MKPKPWPAFSPDAMMKNGYTEILRWEIPSGFRWLPVIDAAMQEIGQELEWDQGVLNQISIAVVEAVSNAIEHGNKFGSKKQVQVELRLSEDDLELRVLDLGDGFDSSLLTATAPSLDDPRFLNARGRGIFIMREIMDEIRTRTDETGRFVLELHKSIRNEAIADQ
jgi:serine/threonine-protein kinase RsbW